MSTRAACKRKISHVNPTITYEMLPATRYSKRNKATEIPDLIIDERPYQNLVDETHMAAVKVKKEKLDTAVGMVIGLNEKAAMSESDVVAALMEEVRKQKITIEKQEVNHFANAAQYDHVTKGQRVTIDQWKDNFDSMRKSLTALRTKLAVAFTDIEKAQDKADYVRDELNTLRYILETGEHPLCGSPFCPVSQTSLMRNDVVAVFECDYNCNTMIKGSVSGPCVANFKDGTDLRCMKCFETCNKVGYSTTAQATANFSWRKLEKLTGCGDFDAVSIRRDCLTQKKLEDERAFYTKDLMPRLGTML